MALKLKVTQVRSGIGRSPGCPSAAQVVIRAINTNTVEITYLLIIVTSKIVDPSKLYLIPFRVNHYALTDYYDIRTQVFTLLLREYEKKPDIKLIWKSLHVKNNTVLNSSRK